MPANAAAQTSRQNAARGRTLARPQRLVLTSDFSKNWAPIAARFNTESPQAMARELAGRYRLTAKNNIELRRFCHLAAGGEIESMTGKVTGLKIDSRGRVLSVV